MPPRLVSELVSVLSLSLSGYPPRFSPISQFSFLGFPQEFAKFREEHGDLSILDTRTFVSGMKTGQVCVVRTFGDTRGLIFPAAFLSNGLSCLLLLLWWFVVCIVLLGTRCMASFTGTLARRWLFETLLPQCCLLPAGAAGVLLWLWFVSELAKSCSVSPCCVLLPHAKHRSGCSSSPLFVARFCLVPVPRSTTRSTTASMVLQEISVEIEHGKVRHSSNCSRSRCRVSLSRHLRIIIFSFRFLFLTTCVNNQFSLVEDAEYRSSRCRFWLRCTLEFASGASFFFAGAKSP